MSSRWAAWLLLYLRLCLVLCCSLWSRYGQLSCRLPMADGVESVCCHHFHCSHSFCFILVLTDEQIMRFICWTARSVVFSRISVLGVGPGRQVLFLFRASGATVLVRFWVSRWLRVGSVWGEQVSVPFNAGGQCGCWFWSAQVVDTMYVLVLFGVVGRSIRWSRFFDAVQDDAGLCIQYSTTYYSTEFNSFYHFSFSFAKT